MRITLVIAGLTAGGAERNMTILANAWAAKGWAVTLLSLDDGREPPFYPLHPEVRHRALALQWLASSRLEALRGNVERVRRLRRSIVESRPEAVLSFMDRTNVLTLLATVGLDVPVVVSERVDPAMWPIGRIWTTLRLATYRRATWVAVQSENARAYFPVAIQRHTRVVPNPVIIPPGATREPQGQVTGEQGPPGEATGGLAVAGQRDAVGTGGEKRIIAMGTGGEKRIIAMGRFVEQKGFDLLLTAFARLSGMHPEWELVIWGDGPLRPVLEAQIAHLGLQGRASLPGRTQDAYGEMRKSDLFVLSSRFEGFPNVLCEAMACGLPVVSFDCPSGPRDIIRPGVDGVLVPPEDLEALVSALGRLMSDADERRRLASRAPEVVERFRLERILELWETLLRGRKTP